MLQRALLPWLTIGSGAIVLLALFVLRGSGEPVLIGTMLGGSPAPDFTLTDHRGKPVSLSDFRGKVIALTFIYTDCPDVCPITVKNLSAANEQLPEEKRDDVALIAITVDPKRDTQAALRAFSERHGLVENPNWYALRGDAATLERIWHAYGIYPGTRLATPVQEHTTPALGTPVPGGGQGHTDAIYLIDPEGRERVLMRSYIEVDSLVHNLRVLAD
ncbi:MAG: SCO family protein [Rhizobiales bacterium]|nr:SCO family protein [Hyphomicrobiales bacterium]